MNYNKLWLFEVRQFVRFLWEDYINIKLKFRLLEQSFLVLWYKTKEDIKILLKYTKFKSFLEKELKKIYKEVWEEDLKDLLYLFPKTQRKFRNSKKTIRLNKRNKSY